MRFYADKAKTLVITATLQPNAMGPRAFFSLNRQIGGAMREICPAGDTASQKRVFKFSPEDLAAWSDVSQLEFDVTASLIGSTGADLLVDVAQVDNAGHRSECENRDPVPEGKPKDFLHTIDKQGVRVASGLFAIVF